MTRPVTIIHFRLLFVFALWAHSLQAAVVDGVTYTNFTRPGPIEIHLVRITRREAALELRSLHSGGKPVGRSPVSEQIRRIGPGIPIAAINGDFFQLEGPFAGDPRGLQIVQGALISAPANNGSFWIDSAGGPHMAVTRSSLRVTWPNGATAPLVLNAPCGTNQLALYSPDLDAPWSDSIAREIVLIPNGKGEYAAKNASTTNGPLLRAGETYLLTVSDLREGARDSVHPETSTARTNFSSRNSTLPGRTDGKIPPGAFVLALGTTAAKKAPTLQPGAILKISTATTPNLRDAIDAISGGPLLVIRGKQQLFESAGPNASRQRFTIEKHPRTALGWSEQEYIWVEVDGRRQDSIGMTLNELGSLMIEFGCVEAMNLDGGGSSTLWFDGQVRNHPSDGKERPVANILAVVRKPSPPLPK